ncbi:MAG: hypothetical protein WCA78_01415 [Rhizomicrobium sp.]
MGLPKEARYISDWSLNSGLTYREFLQAKEFETSLRFAIDEQTRKLIGSNEQLLKRGFHHISDDLRGGFSMLSRDIANLEQTLRQGIAELASAIRWGFTVLAIAIRQMYDTLEEIKHILQNPSLNWACEQFNKARDDYNRGLYPEALQSINRAIHGHGSNTGWDTEFRFHFLLGRIQIGSWIGHNPNTSADVVNPEQAEKAFLSAARYHRGGDVTKDTGKIQALLFAGRAAFYQGAVDRAIEHSTIPLLNKLPVSHPLVIAAWYQRAKYRCAQGSNLSKAKAELISAAEKDPTVLVDAAADQDFLARRKEVLDEVIAEITDRLRKKYELLDAKCAKTLNAVKDYKFDGTTAQSLLGGEIAALEKEYQAVVNEAAGSGALDLDSALKMANALLPKFLPLFGLYKKRFAEDRRRQWNAARAVSQVGEAKAREKECADDLEKARGRASQRKSATGINTFRVVVTVLLLLASPGFLMANGFLTPRGLDFSPTGGGYTNVAMALLFIIVLWLPLIGYLLEMPFLLITTWSARRKLVAAQRGTRRAQANADRAWKTFQRKIDELERTPSPF